MSEAKEKTPWKDGYWLPSWAPNRICIVKGSNISEVSLASIVQDCPEFQATTEIPGKLIYGNFGKAASKLLKEKTGLSEYNIKMAVGMAGILKNEGTVVLHGILTQKGTKCYFELGDKKIAKFQWLNEDGMKGIFDSVEHLSKRSHPYKIQPPNQGKLIFLSGPTMCGKSMTALELAQKEGFVFYEADLLSNLMNPYFPHLMTIPTLNRFLFEDMPKGNVSNQKSMFPFFKLLTNDILSEKEKIGGDWVVASFAMPTRKIRDFIKKECNATFIVFTQSEEILKKRLSSEKAHYVGLSWFPDWAMNVLKCYEPVQPDEKDAYEIVLTPEMGKEEVVQNVLSLIKNVDQTNSGNIGNINLPPIMPATRQKRGLRLPKIQSTYLPSIGEVRVRPISGQSVATKVYYNT